MNAELSAQARVEEAHRCLWERFIDAHGVILDYAGPGGEVELPNAQDCALGRPNAIGWWSPIENGAFFNGLYLQALCDRWRRTRSGDDLQKARRIAEGLLKLASISEAPGFIARGVGGDGRCHYPMGSDDQTHPWFLGLYRYLKSGIPEGDEKTRVEEKFLRVAAALEKSGWKGPCDGPFAGDTRGDFTRAEFRGAANLLFIQRALHDLTGDAAWLEKYRRMLREVPEAGPYDRLAICARGCLHDLPHIPDIRKQMWIVAGAQSSLVELLRLEEDADVRKALQEGLMKTQAVAAEGLIEYRKFVPDPETPYRVLRWREAFPVWRPQPTQAEAQRLAIEQLGDLDRIDKDQGRPSLRALERHFMQQPLAAACVASLGASPVWKEEIKAGVDAVLRHYDYGALHTSSFFFAECAWEALERGEGRSA
jgi:hypothetical protein